METQHVALNIKGLIWAVYLLQRPRHTKYGKTKAWEKVKRKGTNSSDEVSREPCLKGASYRTNKKVEGQTETNCMKLGFSNTKTRNLAKDISIIL
jgi:hypothetical protein